MIWGVAGLRPNFFLQRPNFLAELAQESWRDLAAGSALSQSVSQVSAHPQAVCVDQLRWIHSFSSYSQCTTTTVYSVASVSDSQSDVTVV
jgi:hypothetical protein